MTDRRTLHMVSLGCPKNRVDSEVMLGVAFDQGFEIVDDPAEAEVIVVNTCGFIDSAKQESIDTIFGLAKYKEAGKCQRLVVCGCLAQRYHAQLSSEIPEIDNILGSGDVMQIGAALDGSGPRVIVGSAAGYLVRATDPRVVSTGLASAYVKIAEGCDRQCAFCVIPAIRGKHRSRTVDDVVAEVKSLVSQGVLEVNLVSQDTIAYGRDLTANHKSNLAELVRKVAEVDGIHWVRLLYLYPDALDDELLELMSQHPRVLPYVDMPMQHASDEVLKRMRRGHSNARLRKTVERLRTNIKNLTFRTSFIVGFPGETDAHFEELCDFIRWAKFDRLGVFRFSDEEDAPSFALADKVPAKVSYNRARHLMSVQRDIAKKSNRKLVGQTLEVLVEGKSVEHELVMSGRHAGQAPDIDGQVFFTNSDVQAGELRRAKIVKATDYDVVAEVLNEPPLAKSVRTSLPRRKSLPVVSS